MMPPLSARLREATRDLHARLDSSLPLLSPGLTRGQYAAFLARMLAWLEPTETHLAAVLPERLPLRRRAGAIDRDLAALGVAKPAAAPSTSLPVLASEAQAVGCFYVLEGSALGGQLVSRHVERTLGLTANEGAAYFSGDGAGTGTRWRTVCKALDDYDLERGPDVIDGARRTFSSLISWLP
jgi:heme oxygenase